MFIFNLWVNHAFAFTKPAQYARNVWRISEHLRFQGQFLSQQRCFYTGGGFFCFCFLHNRLSSVLAVKTKLCFLNDTSAQGTLGQQPPDVCESYFRHKSVSVRATALFSNPTRAHTHTNTRMYLYTIFISTLIDNMH